MAASTQQKVDFLLKKIGYTASKTGLAEDSSLSGTKKAPFAEAVPSPLVIATSSVWADSEYIPGTPPGSSSSYVQVYLSGTSGHHMTVDSTVSGNRAYIAYSTYNNSSTAILGDWIDTQFGASYIIKVYKGDPNSGGVSLSAAGSGSNDGWFFDYSSGILNFNDTNVPSGVTDSNIYVVGYRYIGGKGVLAPAGIGTFNSLEISGVSTFSAAIDANAGADISGGVGLNVVGHTELDEVNVSGVSTYGGAIDANAGILASTLKVEDLTATRVVLAGTGGEIEDNAKLTFTTDKLAVTGGLTVSAGATFAGIVDGNAGANISGGEATFSSATVSDLTDNRVVIAGTSGALEDSGNLTFSGTKLTVTGNAQVTTDLDVDGGANISGGVGLDVVGHTELDEVNVSGVSTYGGAADFNAGADISGGVGLNVVGHTEVDNFNASGVSTFAALVDGNAGANFSGGETTLSSATVSDLTDNRVVIAGTSGALEDSGNLTFSGTKLTVTGNAQVTTDLDVDGGANISGGVGLNVVGHTELDEVNVSGVSTFAGLVDGNAGANFSGAETTLSSATVSDLTNNRVVLAGTAGSLEDSSAITFDGSNLAIVGGATFTGNVTIGGTLTSEDKTNVDSVGLITARTGVRITSGGLIVSSGVNTFTDAIDANGGANIAGGFVANSAKISDLTSGRVVVAGTDGELEDASTFTFSGGTVTATNFSGNLTGTLQTAAQPNVTSLGTIASLVASTAKVSDLTATRVVLAGTAGELEDNSKLTFTTDKLAVTGGLTVSAGATLSSNLNVDGGADISGGVGLNVVGHTELDEVNVSGVSTYGGAIDANGGADISGGVGLNVVGHSELDEVNVSGVSTYAGAIDANAGAHISGGIGLEVVGHTEVDNFSASGVSTFAALVDGNAGANFSGAETVLSSATVSDLTENRVVIAGADGALEDASTLTFDGTKLQVGTAITMYQATGIVSASYFYGDGSNLLNAGSLLSASSGVQRIVTTSLTSGTMTSAGTDADLNFDTSSNTLNAGKVNVAGVGTFGGLVDGNAGCNFSGAESTFSSATVSDLTDNRVVIAGTSGALEDSGNLTFDGTQLTVTGNAQVTTDLDVDGGANISGGVGLAVVGHSELDNLNVSGVSTYGGAADFNAGVLASTLKVEDLAGARVVVSGTGGEIEDSANLTWVSNGANYLGLTGGLTVSAASTFSGIVDGNAGCNFSGAESVLSSATVSDLTAGRVVVAGTSGALEDASTFTFSGGTVSATAFSATDLTGTLQTAAQTNVTSLGTLTGLAVNGDLALHGPAGVSSVTWDKSDNALEFLDHAKATFGTSADLQIWHEGTGSIIRDNGTGNLNLQTNGNYVNIQNTSYESLAKFKSGGSVELYFDNSKKIETTFTGAIVTGILTATGTTSTLGNVVVTNAAAGAGATVGSNDAGITTYHGNLTGTLNTAAQTNITSLGTLTGLTVDGDLQLEGDSNKDLLWDKSDAALEFAGWAKATFDDTFQIYKGDGGSDAPTITDTSGNAMIMAINGGIEIRAFTTGEKYIKATENDATELYFNGSKKIETTHTGAIVTGILTANGTTSTLGNVVVTNAAAGVGATVGSNDAGITTYHGNLTGTVNTAAQTNITSVGTLDGLTVDDDATFNGSTTNMVWDKSDSALEFNNILKIYNTDGSSRIEGSSGGMFFKATGAYVWSNNSLGTRFEALDSGCVQYGNGGRVTQTSAGKFEVGDGAVALGMGITMTTEGNARFGWDGISGTGIVTATSYYGTLQTAAQTNITSVGVLGSLVVNGDLSFQKSGVTSCYWDSSETTFQFNDHTKLNFGAGGDLSIYHDATNDRYSTGTLGDNIIASKNKNLYIMSGNADEAGIRVYTDGKVDLSHNGTPKLETTTTGVTVQGLTCTGNNPVSMGSTTVSQLVLKDYTETVSVIGDTGTSATLNLANGNVFTATLTGNCTFTFTTGVNRYPNAQSFTLILANDSTPSRTITWPASVKWPNNSAPSRTTTASKTDIWTFMSPDNGTTWYGNIALYNFT